MGGFIKLDVERVETTALNTKINKEVFDNFKASCKRAGYPLNVMLETFMLQYANGRFELKHDEIMKWKKDFSKVETLNTTFNKEIYTDFKTRCKDNGYFLKYVVTAFMEEFVNGEYVLEYRQVNDE